MAGTSTLKFCSNCAGTLRIVVPEGDDRERHVCSSCGAVHYVNPKAVVGCMVAREDRLLLCRRAIEPRPGLWTPPCGFQELHETSAEGAMRETWEEARAKVRILGPFAHLDIPHISQSYLLYRSELVGEEFAAGPESSEVRLFSWNEIPWDEIAFPVLYLALRLYAGDREAGRPRTHFGSVYWNGEGSRFDFEHYELRDHHALIAEPASGSGEVS
jgi:ADP-ribose pyrophosphatase YjhB (NUDIX family)